MVFFDDAEVEPMPVMVQQATWEEIKQGIQIEANSMLK